MSEVFGGAAAADVLDELVADGVLRRRPTGWFWPSTRERPAASVDIRGSGLGQVAMVEAETGRMLGTVDGASAPATAHPGAVYLHRGESYLVEELDLEAGVALVCAADPDWRTDARSTADVEVARVLAHRDLGDVRVSFGEVTVTSQVVAYQRRAPDGTVLETVPLDLPEQTLRTRGVWYDIDEGALIAAGVPPVRIPGALHAAEHAAIGLLPLFAICDRWDIGGMSTALHPHTGRPTVFVHDGHPGGAGFAERGHAVLAAWLTATRDGHRRLRVPHGLPVLRAVAEVRQRERAARQGGRGDRAGTGAGRAVGAGTRGNRVAPAARGAGAEVAAVGRPHRGPGRPTTAGARWSRYRGGRRGGRAGPTAAWGASSWCRWPGPFGTTSSRRALSRVSPVAVAHRFGSHDERCGSAPSRRTAGQGGRIGLIDSVLPIRRILPTVRRADFRMMEW